LRVRDLLIAVLYPLLILIFLFAYPLPAAYCQADWKQSNVVHLHPKDMTEQERQQWTDKLKKIEDALEEVSDPNKYEKGKYECNNFSDFTAQQLAAKCFTVKRAKSTKFRFADNTTGEHHWVFIVTKVGNKEVWVPVECSPPEGEKQKGEEWESLQRRDKIRTPGDQWPKIAYDEGYCDPNTGAPKFGGKFDERYFGNIQIKDVPKPEGCTDPLAALDRTIPFALATKDALTREPVSLPLEIYHSDGILACNLTTAANGTATAELPTGTYYVKAKLNILWFYVTVHTSPEIVLDSPHELNIMIFAIVPVKWVPIASYVACGLLIAAVLYHLLRLVIR